MISRIVQIHDKELEITQDNNFGYAGEVWDAALVLCPFIANEHCNLICPIVNMNVLELGSGTGICGLACAAVGCKSLVMTDLKNNIPLIEKNYEINKEKVKNTEIKILPLDWTDKSSYDLVKNSYDVIICSDVIYDPVLFQPLIDTLDYLVTPQKTIVLFAYTFRKNELGFFKILDNLNNWKYERVPEKLLDEEYRADDIFIIRLYKLK